MALLAAVSCNKDDSVVDVDNRQISSQLAVDNFNFTSVKGPLHIYGKDITNLNGLSSLVEVGSLYISNTSLQNLNGLHNVNRASREDFTLSIDANPLLEDVSALSNISNKSTILVVRKSPMLGDLNGLGFSEAGESIILDSLIVSNVGALNDARIVDRINFSRMSQLVSIRDLKTFNLLSLSR